ncbi:MAG: hypothetical protein AAF244_00555 [Pseudomonadota bacterium]
MKIPTYVQNPTNVHCQQAVQAMVLVDFRYATFAGSRMFGALDKMNHAEPNQWTSDYPGILGMAQEGMSVVFGSSYDLTEYADGPYGMYLKYCGRTVADTFNKRLNLESCSDAARNLSNFSASNYRNIKKSVTKDILELLDRGYLVNAWVDSGRMRESKKFSGHYVLLYGHDGTSITFHDPGGSLSRGSSKNISNRMTINRFDQCRRYPETNNTGTFIAYRQI